MESTVKALVLKVGRFREVDAWVRLFSPSKGLFTAFAFGASVSRRRFCGCLSPFNLLQAKIKTPRAGGYTYLMETVLLAGHQGLRQGPERLGMAVNCLKFLEKAHAGQAGSQTAYALLLGTLEALAECPCPSPLVPLLFRARLAFDQGLRPDFVACYQCGKNLDQAGAAVFLVQEGRLLCPDCRGRVGGPGISLGVKSLEFLRAVSHDSPRAWSGLIPDSRARGECALALEQFVQYHVGLSWNNGSFARN
jgi:DNA repair protein RecO (recombination protein O)